MNKTEKIREEWHVRTFNMANEVSDYSKVEMQIADWWIEKIHQAEQSLLKQILSLPTHPAGYAQERMIKPSDIERFINPKE